MSAADERTGTTATGVLDVSAFKAVLHLTAVRVPKQDCQIWMKALKGQVLDRPRLKTVVIDPSDEASRLVLLHERIDSLDGHGLPAELLTKLSEARLMPLVQHQLELDYSYWTAEQVLKKLLPEGVEVPGSFETIGHVAHVNLRDEALPYKEIIGRVLLDKNLPRIRTVVNKVGTIENTFRVPDFELLAGDTCLETEVKQHGATFRLDFGKVYWNSRLEKEHLRLVSTYLSSSSVTVCDMMAGIGPFAIPAAMEGCQVYANDLNPDSTKYLQTNVALNKVKTKVRVFTMDARKFVLLLLGRLQQGPDTPQVDAPVKFQHVIMNLPATAIEFLDVFKGAFDREQWTPEQLPTIHCYLFARTAETKDDIVKRGEHHLGARISDAIVHPVRDVAPNKHMYCLSFKLSTEAAYSSAVPLSDDGSLGNPKRIRLKEAGP